MVNISFNGPDVCPNCGSHNWEVVGSVLNDGVNITQINLCCMRCRTIIHCDSHFEFIEQAETIDQKSVRDGF